MQSEITSVALNKNKLAIIDGGDSQLVQGYVWYEMPVRDTSYAATAINGRTVYMHRLIMSAPTGIEVDHKNGDGLDNRRCNLRLATHQENLANQKLSRANTSGYKGVVLQKSGTWRAQAKHSGKMYNLGSYHKIEDAARAYDLFMRERFGAYAKVNFPDEVLAEPPQRITKEEADARKTRHLVGRGVSEETRKKIGEANRARRMGAPWTQAQREARERKKEPRD